MMHDAIPPDELVVKVKTFCSRLNHEQLMEFLSIESDYVAWLIRSFSKN